MTDNSEEAVQSKFEADIKEFQADCDRIVEEVRSVIVGHHTVIDEVLACILGGGHALLEGVPGLGKTLLVSTLGEVLDLSSKRIQFTPDLMPADITGTNMVTVDASGAKSFKFEPGPIFANLVLADEINRATPKTQSAVLEAMQERTVSLGRTSHKLDEPFFVLATQNPLELEGTYPLPEAQIDRFMCKINLDCPGTEELIDIIDRTTTADHPKAKPVVNAERIMEMRSLVRRTEVASHVKHYVARLVQATHSEDELAPPSAKKYVRYGASPRGAQAIIMTAKVRALRSGRGNIAFVDVQAVAAAALRHRLILSFEGQAEEIQTDTIISEVLDSLPQTPPE
ncbi:MAG: AAA family ATPase [Planctomycetes bacterium]|nr:AAA family ATPase [Planctomycetota bacterium]